jgi:hypothetical protein
LIRGDETDLERLERELRELQERLVRHEEDVTRRFELVDRDLRETAANLGARVDSIETRQRELRRAALRKDIRGAYVFMVGAALSAAGNIV